MKEAVLPGWRLRLPTRMAVVGTPGYFARHPKPAKPQHLVAHSYINIRLPTYGGIYAWEFEKRGLRVRVDGQLLFNTITLRMNAVLARLGLAYLPEDQVRAHLADRRLVRVLAAGVRRFQAITSITRGAAS